MARVTPTPGTTVEENIRTRIIPNDEPESADERDFWEFQSALSPEAWKKYMVYVYRRQGDRLGAYVGKYGSAITEDQIAELHGGGQYRIFLKTTAGEIKKRAELEIEGAPKIANVAPSSIPASSNGNSDRSLDRLCDLLERVIMKNDSTAVQGDALRAALNLQSEGFRSVVTNVREIAAPQNQPAAANPMDELTRTFMQAAVQKMLNPVDPIESFGKMLAAVKTLGLDGGGAKASIGAELVRTVGGAIPQIMDGVKSYTLAVTKQAELEMMRIANRGVAAPVPAQPPMASAAPAPTVIPAGVPGQPQQETQVVMTIEDVERRIAAFFMDTRMTVLDAANGVLDFVEQVSGPLYEYICKLDEPNLTAFINSRPILSQIPKDPRFSEIVKKIVELTHEPPAASDSPNTAPQTPA